MTKKSFKGPQMLIANRLGDGRAVFYTGDDTWSPHVALSAVVETPEALKELLLKASKHDDNNSVISIEAIAADVSDEGIKPAHIKYRMQSTGPSVRTDLGYQSGQFAD